MDFYTITDSAVLDELGHRLRELRLRRNLTQEELAERAGISTTAVKSLEAGRSRIATLVSVLRALDQLQSLDQFLPNTGPSPLQLIKLQGKRRERATGSRKTKQGRAK